jgi:hypothetical protein
MIESLEQTDVSSLKALRALRDLETHLLTLLEGLVSVLLDLREVNEDVLTTLPLDEAETLLVAEPLNGAFGHFLLLKKRRPIRANLVGP